MCVIMSSGPEVPVPTNEHLINANAENPHGFGVSINLPNACRGHKSWGPFGAEGGCPRCRHNSQIITLRGFTTEELIAAVKSLDALRTAASSLVVHCRIATGGTITLDNTHPFPVTEKLYLFHNGIFSEEAIPTHTNPLKPDSYHLAQLLTPCLGPSPSWMHAPTFTEWLDDLCTTGYPSKVLLLDAVYGSVMYNLPAWVDGGEGRMYSNGGPLIKYETYEDFWEENADLDDAPPYNKFGFADSAEFSEWSTWKDDYKNLQEDLLEEQAYAHKHEKTNRLLSLYGR